MKPIIERVRIGADILARVCCNYFPQYALRFPVVTYKYARPEDRQCLTQSVGALHSSFIHAALSTCDVAQNFQKNNQACYINLRFKGPIYDRR